MATPAGAGLAGLTGKTHVTVGLAAAVDLEAGTLHLEELGRIRFTQHKHHRVGVSMPSFMQWLVPGAGSGSRQMYESQGVD